MTLTAVISEKLLIFESVSLQYYLNDEQKEDFSSILFHGILHIAIKAYIAA